MDNQLKVLFVQKVDDGYEIEGLWCTKIGDNYVIDNIPFIAKRVSLGDTIKAEYDSEENAYYFDDFIEVSGNTTVRVYPLNNSEIDQIKKVLVDLGCECEIFLERKIIAVNVPSKITYKPIKDVLDEGENKGKWKYEESCLAHKV